MKIGIAGTGRMGTAIGQRLMGEGHELIVWNRTKDKTKLLVDAGAKTAASPAALAKAADIIITILTDAAAIDATYRGKDGLLSGDVAGKLFIEMSTVRPETEQKLAGDIRAKGATMVEAPVGGTTAPAKEGKLIGLVGGDEKDVARALPILEKLCRRGSSMSGRSERARASSWPSTCRSSSIGRRSARHCHSAANTASTPPASPISSPILPAAPMC